MSRHTSMRARKDRAAFIALVFPSPAGAEEAAPAKGTSPSAKLITGKTYDGAFFPRAGNLPEFAFLGALLMLGLALSNLSHVPADPITSWLDDFVTRGFVPDRESSNTVVKEQEQSRAMAYLA